MSFLWICVHTGALRRAFCSSGQQTDSCEAVFGLTPLVNEGQALAFSLWSRVQWVPR